MHLTKINEFEIRSKIFDWVLIDWLIVTLNEATKISRKAQIISECNVLGILKYWSNGWKHQNNHFVRLKRKSAFHNFVHFEKQETYLKLVHTDGYRQKT